MSEKMSTVYAILCCKQRHHDGNKKRKIVFGNNKDKLDCMNEIQGKLFKPHAW